jgi:glycosyltransferase involved in cell wall biosynthesis
MIPAYNSEKSIALSLASCVSQTVHMEIVVVDNCSTDRCLDLFKSSKYEYVMFLFTGDELKPSCIEEVEKVFQQYPNLGAVFWPYEFKRGDNISIFRHYEESRYLSPEEINELNINEGGRLGAIVCNVYSKSAIVESGAYFNEIFIGKADFDYCVLQHHGVFYLNNVLSTFNVEHHGTFQYALDNYRVNIEASFNSACALERSRDSFPLEKYEKFRNNIILGILRKNIHFLSLKDLVVIPRIVSNDLYRRLKGRLRVELGKLRRYVK